MPQPHITHETYKGLTPDEQAKYGEAQHQKEISEGEWVTVSAKESFIWSGPTRIVHYLKPVEAQQSEGDVIKQKADDIFGKEPSGPKLHWTIGFQDGAEWQAQQVAAQLTALQQEVERLKEAQRWIPVTITPKHDKFYQLAFNEDMYLKFYQWHMLDLSNRPTPCFISCSGDDIMEKHEVTHYREIHTDPPE